MQQMQQEIKELQATLGAVVQALNFIQSFLESDYGLKFQFHAYCSSPLYSHDSSVLAGLKEKYPCRSGSLQDAFYNDRVYQSHGNSSPDTDNTPSIPIRYPIQGTIEELEQTVMSTVTSSACASSSNAERSQNYDSVSNIDHSSGNVSTAHARHISSPTTSCVSENLSNTEGSPIIVNEEDLFGINDLAIANMKVEALDAHDIYQRSQAGVDSFGQQELEDEGNLSDEIVTTKKPTEKKNSKRNRAQKQKAVEGYKCPHCRRRCGDKTKLEQHMSHHKQQFQCSECGIWLADKSVLNRHMRTHTGDRPFKCAFCKESFSRQDIVKKHMQRKHKEMIGNPVSI